MPSLSLRLVRSGLRLLGNHLRDAEKFRGEILGRKPPEVAPVPHGLRRQAKVEQREVMNCPVYTLVPRTQASRWHIIYIHGGAWVYELAPPHWWIIGALIKATGATVTAPIYPLAPKHTYRDAYPLLAEVYRQVLKHTPAENIVFCGDSAGGGLAAGLALHTRDLGLPMPARLLLFAPAVDLTFSNPEVDKIEPHDVLIARPGGRVAADWWAGGDDIRNPLISPMYGDLFGLPPVDIFQGTEDSLLPDARVFRDRLRAAGVPVQLLEYPGAFHVFMGATFTPEARDTYDKIAQVLPRAKA